MILQSYSQVKKEALKNWRVRFWYYALTPWYLWQIIKIKYENKTR